MISKSKTNENVPPKIFTKWGYAKVNNEGYYQIISSNCGFRGKLLHRLIYENTYGEIPKGYVIHHINENKLDNSISNLEAITRESHNSHHHKGIPRSEETKRKIALGNKGKKLSAEQCKQISERMKGNVHSLETRRKISESNKGKVISSETRRKISEAKKGTILSEQTKKKIGYGLSKSTSTTGYYRVYKQKDSTCKQGFIWKYQYTENGNKKTISRVSFSNLKKEVLKRGLHWEKLPN